MWILKGLLCGLIFGVFAYIVFAFIFCGISALYNRIKNGEFFINDKSFIIPVIPAVIIFAMCLIYSIQILPKDKLVDFYDDNGQIVETYEIEYYSTEYFGNGVTFYLTDGRTIVKQDCTYNVRFEEKN